MFFLSCVVIKLCNINQQNTRFLNQYFNFDILYMFQTRGFIFRKTILCKDIAQYVLHASVKAVQYVEEYGTRSSTYLTADTDACKTYSTIPIYKTVFLKVNSRVRNTQKTSKLKYWFTKGLFFNLYFIIKFGLHTSRCPSNWRKFKFLHKFHRNPSVVPIQSQIQFY